MDADLVVLDLRSTPLIDYRMRYARDFDEALAIQMALADDRAIRATYIAGTLAYERAVARAGSHNPHRPWTGRRTRYHLPPIGLRKSPMKTCAPAKSSFLWIALAASAALLPRPAISDEGVWTFDHPPAKALEATYGFTPSVEWLDALRLSAVRIGGGSGSFVSGNGLVLTNHHIAMGCLQSLSTATDDLVKNGFHARVRGDERKCPGMEVRRLESTEDVTTKVRAAVTSGDDAKATVERNVAIAALENDCKEKTGLRCEVITLYRGAAYHVYRYKTWNDVRLVFAPEGRLGFFGGDPDNFVFPRFDLDFSLMRVYEQGEAIKTAGFLKWAKAPLANGDLVFAAGHPGSTKRLFTAAQITFERDAYYPLAIATATRQRRALQEYSARSPESERRAADALFGFENWLKSMVGEYKALREPELFAAKAADEARLRKLFSAAAAQSDPWVTIEHATAKASSNLKSRWAVGYGYGTLFGVAGRIVELANESTLAEADRLPEYRASKVPRIVDRVTADDPYYKDLEIAQAGRDMAGGARPAGPR